MENYDSDYSVRLATLEQMGGDITKHYDSVYEIDLEILKLTEEGGGGAAIKNVDELPDAAENKNNIVRLSTDGKLYAPYLKSRTTTSTNRLPDEQQIDKAYLYYFNDVYYYKGTATLICSDGSINGYLWYNSDEFFIISYEGAENVNGETYAFYSEDMGATIEDGIISTDFTLETLGLLKDTMNNLDMHPIPATYNAPEANQIGNAFVSDSNYGVIFTYTGEEIEFTYDEETKIGYKWIDSEEGLITISSKIASDIYCYLVGDEEGAYTDVDWYIDNDGEIEPYEEIPTQLYIPQLNAPDSEQVNVAKIHDTVHNADYIYTGEQVEIICSDNVSVPAYKWISSGSVEWDTIFSNAADTCYSSIPSGKFDDDDINIYDGQYYCVDESSILIAQINSPLDDNQTFEYSDIVKYQRTETTEVWDWEMLNKEQEPAILSTETLPDVNDNTDKFYRTNNDGKLYAAKVTSSFLTYRLPDAQQIDKAYLYANDGWQICYYKGATVLHCSDGDINGYLWYQNEDTFYISKDNAENISANSAVVYSEDSYDVNPPTIVNGEVYTDCTMDWLEWSEGSIYTFIPILATYNAPEANQIGNATFTETLNGESCVYNGTQVTIIDDVSGEEVTAYKWISLDDENSYVATSKPASEIYFSVYHFEEGEGTDYVITDVKVWYVNSDDSTEGTQFETDLYIPQANAPDNKQVNSAYVKCSFDGENIQQYNYKGRTTIHCTDGDYTAYMWLNGGSLLDLDNLEFTPYSANDVYNSTSFMALDGGNLWDYITLDGTDWNSTLSLSVLSASFENDMTDALAGAVSYEISTVKYQRTQNNYEWKELIPDEIRISTTGDITVDGNGKINGVQNLSFGDYDVDSLKTLLGEVKELKTDIALVMPVGGLDTTFTCQGMMSLLNLSAGGMDMPMLLITFPFLNMSIQKMDKLTIYYDYTSTTWYIESLIDILS